jgi:signal transduction histidine kinase
LTTAAHEFRTPLTSVQGFSEILLTRDLDKERQKRYLTMINTQATHLANIVRDLLDVARLEAGRGLEIKPEPTDLGQLIGETLLPFRETLSNHILVEPNLGEMPLVMADRFRLAQVLENLISNAIKYSPEGGTVTISARTVRYRVELSIQDNGIGMTQEQQKHLFEKFYRADTSNTTISGTGLGLALCKLIVELHRGRIWIESEPGHGATVYFTLPIAESKRDNVSPPS